MSGNVEDTALIHATKHFEIHAAQRLTAFNFFIVISGAILAAIAASFQKPNEFALVGAALGILLVLLSIIFWKLDRRTKFLIKHSESAIKHYEMINLAQEFRVFSNEDAATTAHREKHRYLHRMFSYSEAFGMLFVGSGILGLAGAILLTWSPQLFSLDSRRADQVAEKSEEITKEDDVEVIGNATQNAKFSAERRKALNPNEQTSRDADRAAKHRQNGS